MWQPNERYPDASVRVLDPSFNKYRLPLASVERLYTGCRWSEGPVYFGDGRYLLWSDIPNNRVLRWDEETGAVSIFRKPSNNANGHTRDRRGRLIACEHDARRVVRFEYDGAITVLADDIPGPNGLAFSPDEKKLYVVASRAEPHRTILTYDVATDGSRLDKGAVLIDAGPGGSPDGFRVDIDGNLWCGWGMGSDELDGVRVFDPMGKPIGHIDLPERCANLCFGG